MFEYAQNTNTVCGTMTSAFGTCIYLRFHNICSTDTPQMKQFHITSLFKKVNKNEKELFWTACQIFPCRNESAMTWMWQQTLPSDNTGGEPSCCGWSDSSVLEFGFQMDSLIYI